MPVFVEGHCSHGVDLVRMPVARRFELAACARRGPPVTLLVGRIRELLHLGPERTGACPGHQHVRRVVEDPACEGHRMANADVGHRSEAARLPVGDAGIELQLAGAIEDGPEPRIQSRMILEIPDGDLDRIEALVLVSAPDSGQVCKSFLGAAHASVNEQQGRHGCHIYHSAVAVYVVSDLHGAAGDLRAAVPAGDTLVLLGDLINFLDYINMTGILTEVFSREAVAEVVELRTAGRIDEARRVMQERAQGREEEIREAIGTKARAQYEEVFAAMPDPTYLIYGNVDNPAVAGSYAAATPGVHEPDGSVVVLDGSRFGFVGGALPTPLQVAGEISEEEMRSKIEGLGEVDVLCSHIPPAVPELCYDTLARKSERGSDDLLEYIRDVQPQRAYFGHVHQPLLSTVHIGKTLCVNVGYFRATRRAFLHDPAL